MKIQVGGQEPEQVIGCNCSLLEGYFTLTMVISIMKGMVEKAYKIFQKERFQTLVLKVLKLCIYLFKLLDFYKNIEIFLPMCAKFVLYLKYRRTKLTNFPGHQTSAQQ